MEKKHLCLNLKQLSLVLHQISTSSPEQFKKIAEVGQVSKFDGAMLEICY